MQPLIVTDRVRISRLAERQVTDRQALYDILDAGLVAHVGLVRDGVPVVLPLGYARDGDELLLHGSTGGGLLRAAAAGAPLAVTVTLLDALVFARSLFDSSMNYRSVMVVGAARVLENEQQIAGLRRLSEHLMPGRWAEVRSPSPRELAATVVLAIPLAEASVKVRCGGPTTDPQDGESRETWAGIIPLAVQAGLPEPSPDTPCHVPTPASLDEVRARHHRP
jgi:nitroimidazol reductase NimA-like FMN-containing flavoprotein (pyridoxamine 5'-phosphate oxidase superfamily)